MRKINRNLLVVANWCIIITIVLFAVFYAYPKWSVWKSELNGQAEYRKAEFTKKILITQAQAEYEAATIRAKAIEIVGQKAKEFPEYRQQEFMGAFANAIENDGIDKIFFVPTEANVPIIVKE